MHHDRRLRQLDKTKLSNSHKCSLIYPFPIESEATMVLMANVNHILLTSSNYYFDILHMEYLLPMEYYAPNLFEN